jgi:hypothetical protein
MIKKDYNGMLFSTDLVLTLVLFTLILGTMFTIIDNSKDRTLNSLETAELKKLTSEIVDKLLNNPGTPTHWENLSEFNIVNPGLSIENQANHSFINTISFKKIKILENDNEYDNLIRKKLFNEEIKSSMSIYPINCEIDPIILGDDLESFQEKNEISNIISINRIVKCDFYRDMSLVSIFNGNDISIENIDNNNIDNNINENTGIDDEVSNNEKFFCNHETANELNHSNTESYVWICKGFKISRKDFKDNMYYLLFNEESINNGNHWILDNIEETSNTENNVDKVKIDLNNYFSNILENESSITFYLHSKINKNKLKDYKCVLIGVPRNMNMNNLNIDYFKEQDCYFVMRSSYG